MSVFVMGTTLAGIAEDLLPQSEFSFKFFWIRFHSSARLVAARYLAHGSATNGGIRLPRTGHDVLTSRADDVRLA
ncbi:hypothetical protein [Nocardia sp. NPDC052316]|uniref:hypothetical protein n=1 Tax=Nocardia sp. NPDC052316 TaxID=3364329 RepID=UPI0037C75878